MVSVVIPAKNEPYLNKTVADVLEKAGGEIEVIVVLDGYWPEVLPDDKPNLHIIHYTESKGMRNCINAGMALAKGEYVIKMDAHCMLQKNYDLKLVRDHQPKQVQVPVRYGLNPTTWERDNDAHEFQYIEQGTLKGRTWKEYKAEGRIVPLMTSQGSFWFMEKSFFDEVVKLDTVNYGTMGRECQEVCLKTWTSGGRFVLTRNTWYAHWDKPREWVIGGMKAEKEKSKAFAVSYWTPEKIKSVIDMFAPVPSWSGSTNIVTGKQKGMARADLYTMFAERGYKKGAEIGVWDGVNASVLLSRIPLLHLLLVDPYVDYSLGRKMRGEARLATAVQRAHSRLDGKNVEFMQMMSEEAARLVPDGSLDFVYIDGNHTYDFAMLDILLWSRKVRKGGIISGHDYFNDWEHNVGVRKAVDDYCATHKDIKLNITDYMAESNGKNAKASWWWEI